MATITLETRVRKNDDVFAGVVDRETVAMNIQNGKYYHMNETGAGILALLEEPRSVAALCEELNKRFRADGGVPQQEVIDFVGEMAGLGLVILE